MDIEFFSDLTPEECSKRLSEAIDNPFVSLFGNKPVIGRVNYGQIRLNKRVWYRNSFHTLLSGRLEKDGSGTRITAKSGMHPWINIFLVIFSFAPLALVGRFIGSDKAVDTPVILVAILFPLFSAAVLFFWRFMARYEESFLIDFICEVLEAKRVK